ncbi:MrcB family domain-containing protein [Halorhabdus tiamatea]|uniref:ATPase n=1 Tax=Halorhabdus tiamatea SARL4B TaxID=1033806 RepID=F7PR00_9EURY|nr:DUF3578 domain-containing protein [Halorhabdus tiamatea]CCQ35032.1 ATPase [Halorhabdus tiamatea SARL4B]
MSLAETLRQILSAYPTPSELGADEQARSVSNFPELQKLISETVPAAIQSALADQVDGEFEIAGNYGQGTLAHIPSIAIFQPDETDTTKRGIFVVYLFDPVSETLYLTLNQGATEVDQISGQGFDPAPNDILDRHAQLYRDHLPTDRRFTAEAATLSTELRRSEPYNHGTICYARYDLDDLTDTKQVVTDLTWIVSAYETLLDRLYNWPNLELDTRDVVLLTPPSEEAWFGWRTHGVATLEPPEDETQGSLTQEQIHTFEKVISSGDVLLAVRPGEPAPILCGIGTVTVGHGGTLQSEVREQVDERFGLTEDRFIRCHWASLGEPGVPITVVGDESLQPTAPLRQLSQSLGQRTLGAAARRMAVLKGDVTPEDVLAEFLETLDLPTPSKYSPGDELDDPSVSPSAPYYWVDQTEQSEPDPTAILQAPRDESPAHDLMKLSTGDTLIHYEDGAIVGYSTVEGAAYYHRDAQEREYRRVETAYQAFERPIDLAEIFRTLRHRAPSESDLYPVQPNGVPHDGYLYNLPENVGTFILDRGRAAEGGVKRLQNRLQTPSIEIDLNALPLYFPGGEEARLERQIEAALSSGQHLIFTGPPGTGKSRLARAVCEAAQEQATEEWMDGYTFTTATAEWTTFDTIGGYVPDPESESEQLVFDPRLFLDCFRAEDGTLRNRWLIIDELNRADIDKAFGQLFSVLAEDSVTLPYKQNRETSKDLRIEWVDETTPESELEAIAVNQDRYPVTPAWRLIGTMNTFDKTSLYELSFAFMRRFSFIHMGVPEIFIDQEERIVGGDLLNPAMGPNYATVWTGDDDALWAVLSDHYAELELIWAIVNKQRSIGPAIIRDIAEHVAAFEGGDRSAALTSALVNLVFPQLEGLRLPDYQEFRDDLETGGYVQLESEDSREPIDLAVDVDYLWRTAVDMFQLQPDR